MENQQEILMQKEIIKCYEERIKQLEDEVKFQKEAVEKLFKMLDETIELAKKKQTIFLPTPTLNYE